MKKLPVFYIFIIVRLFLAAGNNGAQDTLRTCLGPDLRKRADQEMTPLRFDSKFCNNGDTGTWPTDPCRQTKSAATGATTTSVSGPLMSQCKSCDWLRFFQKDRNETDVEYMKCIEVDISNKYQTIVIMEEDPAVIESALFLFERNPTGSTLLSYYEGALQILRGGCLVSNGHHELVLVGHGSSGTTGSVLSGYSPEKVARLVAMLKPKILPGRLDTISLISCKTGNDSTFTSQLLRFLKTLGVETKVHLYSAFLSVSSDGHILTRTNGIWRTHDHRRRLIADLNQRGELMMRGELGCAGPAFPGYQGNVLFLQMLDWPRHPQMFVPRELRKKYSSIDCLEGLTWSLFFENERRRAPDYIPNVDQKEAVWLTEPGPEEHITIKHIMNIQDLLVEIRYNAREEVSSDLYYVLNECIYKVHGKNLNVTLVGKFMSTDSKAEIEKFLQSFNYSQRELTLQELQQGLKASKFNDFCRQTFQYQQCNYNCERWGQYFMVAVFSSSVMNFRTFSLFLMSVIGCEVGRSRGTDSSLCTAFVGSDHPMETDKPRPEHLRRGFYGCTVDNYGMASEESQIWLDEIVAKENDLYTRSKQMMNAVDHDEQTELDIFGKVKVMNKYVFSSYLEYFRGTPEGKKLKRGCAPSFSDNYKP